MSMLNRSNSSVLKLILIRESLGSYLMYGTVIIKEMSKNTNEYQKAGHLITRKTFWTLICDILDLIFLN